MSQKLDASPAVIGIDIGKNSYHIIGQNQRGAIVLRQKWSRGQVETARQPAAVLDRHGGLRRRASPQSQAANAWPRRPLDAGEIRARLFEGRMTSEMRKPTRLRVRQHGGDGVPSCLILAPCSG